MTISVIFSIKCFSYDYFSFADKAQKHEVVQTGVNVLDALTALMGIDSLPGAAVSGRDKTNKNCCSCPWKSEQFEDGISN